MLEIRRIYAEPAALALARGQEIVARFPAADVVEVEAHNRIPELYGDETNVARWVRIKQGALVLGVKKTLTARPNGRSADFIAPSTANGCAMACAYCYVPRHKGYSNPITVFANISQISRYVGRHAARQGVKPAPNTCDPRDWVYDIGENSDCSVDALISDNVRDLVEQFRWMPNAKASFATKYVNRICFRGSRWGVRESGFRSCPPPTRNCSTSGTTPVAERIAAIDDFVAAGYEVHVNFSPVVIPRRLARRLGRAARPAGRRNRSGGEGPARRRSHIPDPQPRPASGEPRLAPQSRGTAVAPRTAGAETVAERLLERAVSRQVPLRAGPGGPDRRPHPLLPRPVRVLNTVELLPSPSLEAGIRALWQRLRDAGFPGLADHPHPTNRPHLTLVTAASLDGLPPLPLPLPVTLGPAFLLGRALVRPVTSPGLGALHRDVWTAVGGWPPPAEFVPHVSLALKSSPAALALVADLSPVHGEFVAARTYNTETRVVTAL